MLGVDRQQATTSGWSLVHAKWKTLWQKPSQATMSASFSIGVVHCLHICRSFSLLCSAILNSKCWNRRERSGDKGYPWNTSPGKPLSEPNQTAKPGRMQKLPVKIFTWKLNAQPRLSSEESLPPRTYVLTSSFSFLGKLKVLLRLNTLFINFETGYRVCSFARLTYLLFM